MALELYRKKRKFKDTPEPEGRVHAGAAGARIFVIQKHRASHLHYDFRLELDGVLLSWAVPKGPSLDPADKRLAMHVEDHPIEYADFEGIIPAKQYGGGTVLLWDRGVWISDGDPREAYRKGKLRFRLEGEKLKGQWTLVRARGKTERDDKSWFLIKLADDHARTGTPGVVDELPRSVGSGRDLDEIATAPDRVWQSNRSVAENVQGGAVKRTKPSYAVAKVAGARKAALPEMVSPQLATLAKTPPAGEGWVHEIKYDGYRMVCRIAKGEAQMYSRNGKEWTAQIAPVARALARLPVREAWVDGEVVVMESDGRTSFQALQNALSSGATSQLAFWLFDLVHLDGYDLSGVTLLERKRLLKQVLEGQPALLRYSEHLEGSGADVYAQACRFKLEGIVSKRRDAAYQNRRGTDWLKIKCSLRQEMVIGGYTDPGGARTGFGALLLGVHDGEGNLRYCGKVGTGFNQALLTSLALKLARLEQDKPPFVNPPRGYDAKGAHWIKPVLVGEVEFTEWTRDGTVRHPSFQGLREDKKAADVVLETAIDAASASAAATTPPAAPAEPKPKQAARSATSAPAAVARKRTQATPFQPPPARSAPASVAVDASPKPARPRATTGTPMAAGAALLSSQPLNAVAGIVISNPEKLLYPEAGYSKLDVARYYEAVGERIVMQLRDRPLTLVRCPNGWGKHCFYQKHVKEGTPEVIEQVRIEDSTGTSVYMMANAVPAVIAFLQMGVLEFHPWGSTQQHLDRPDRLIFDFDPDEDLEWGALVDAVTLLRTLLDQVGLRGFLKTTGGKGLHVVVPIRPEHGWDVIKAFTKAIADLLVQASPERFTSKLAKVRRGGKIFVDYLRNAEGATAVAAYSVRAKANAPVSTPIAWEELRDDLRFDHFTIATVPERLRKLRRDPWQAFGAAADQALTAALLQQVGVKLPARR